MVFLIGKDSCRSVLSRSDLRPFTPCGNATLWIPRQRERDGVDPTKNFHPLSRRLSQWHHEALRCFVKTRTCLAPRRRIGTLWFFAVRPLIFSCHIIVLGSLQWKRGFIYQLPRYCGLCASSRVHQCCVNYLQYNATCTLVVFVHWFAS